MTQNKSQVYQQTNILAVFMYRFWLQSDICTYTCLNFAYSWNNLHAQNESAPTSNNQTPG